ncbi:stage II sporulation protein M [Methanolobus profundi]|uniref:Stage II sporulation protein M n=1 Tax=Methanolobus profundi TaxID=487685 RepID=A0A1I4T8E0_9EURY|nr:stage II sporulation protein M [Methanolobus profundi]SFM72863.1 Stage II sporulation protein M [Methanolobus profundi]
MTDVEQRNYDTLKVGTRDIKWVTRVFLLSMIFAFTLGIVAYILTLTFAEPEPVSEAIVSTASAATAKVVITSNYIDPMWAIFIFNSIAASAAVIGSGLFIMVHHLLIGDIAMRPYHRIYTRFSILFELAMRPLYTLLIKITAIVDRDFLSIKNSYGEEEDTIWQYCGYGRDEYRKFSYMLPFTVPLMILMVNGALMGILLAFFTFNGAMTGFELFGNKGIIVGLLYNVIYFFIAIVPHGIIEIPAILLATAIGYRFAYVQAHEVIDKGLFNKDDIEELKKDVAYTSAAARDYILSRYTWKMLGVIILILLVAAYIETYVTLGIADHVMQTIDEKIAFMFGK